MTVPEYESLRERYLKYFPDSPFASNIEGYEEGGYILDDDGNFILSPIDMDVECGGINTVVPFLCGCGHPECVAFAFYYTLCWCDSELGDRFIEGSKPKSWIPLFDKNSFDYCTPESILFYTMLYLANDLDYADHGTSVGSSRLTDKGRFVRDVLREYLKTEMPGFKPWHERTPQNETTFRINECR